MNCKTNGFRLAALFVCLAIVLPLFAPGPAFSKVPSVTGFQQPRADDEDREPFEVAPQQVPDPLRPLNRAFFHFNDKLYFWVLKPVAKVWGAFIPHGVRVCIRNVYHNVLFPVRFMNNVFQGKFEAAGTEIGRFTINTTLGIGGMFDFAHTQYGLDPREEDFGQTLGHYGMQPVFYLNWPILGPSSLRDTIGSAVDTFLNPLTYILFFGVDNTGVSVAVRSGLMVNNASLTLGEYEDFKKRAIDPYVALRDAYLSNRAREVAR
jgi:phospholipid-binding lipoprotein MlaA